MFSKDVHGSLSESDCLYSFSMNMLSTGVDGRRVQGTNIIYFS